MVDGAEPRPRPDITRKYPQWMYWNANGMGTAIVVYPGAVDWAAYIGAQPDPATEEETVDWSARFGCKLPAEIARKLFPHVEGPYRD
jgi:hypothetical protein